MTAVNLNLESVNEDTVQCLFFSPSLKADELKTLCVNINELIENLSTDYIWHRDEFKVFMSIYRETHDIPLHLFSTTCFGDNIEDEWFIMYLVFEITKIYKELVIQVKDNDGEFLLIEAADYLPSWATPENTENRVFIHNGYVHVIPPTLINVDIELDLKDAVEIVRHSTQQTQVSLEIQNAILARIGNCPQKVEQNIHRAVVKLPIDIASLLVLKPSIIAPIVTTYCSHDVIDARSCKNLNFSNCVDISVKFTKCLYAMLSHSNLITKVRYSNITQSDKKSILGLKLTCGYQMIMSRKSIDVFSTKEYNTFLNSLKSNGYFKDNIEGSKQYKELLEKAKEFFLSVEYPVNTQVCDNISQVMSREEFHKTKNSLQCRETPEDELLNDSEDWLNVHPEQLNDLLNSHYGKQAKFKKDDVISAQTITSELSNFLNQTSGFEGVEDNDDEDSNDGIQFDSDEFVNSLQKMMNLISCGDRNEMEDISDIDDYDDFDSSTKDTIDIDMSEELSAKLQGDKVSSQDSKTILNNIAQSMKEEQASSGPSSNLLRTIGFKKTDVLDSDDDLE